MSFQITKRDPDKRREPRLEGPYDSALGVLRVVILRKVKAQLAVKSYEREREIIVQVEQPRVFGLTAFPELVEELARLYKVTLEKEGSGADCYVRLVLPVTEPHRTLGLEDYLRTELDAYSRWRHA